MKRLVLLLVLLSFCFVPNIYADRNATTITEYQSSALIRRGDIKIYSIYFKATANGGNFIIYDATEPTGGSGVDLSEIKAEGSEVTALGDQYQDFSDKPLELSNLYLVITSGYVILRYE